MIIPKTAYLIVAASALVLMLADALHFAGLA